MSDIQPSRQELENLWGNLLEDAKVRLGLASKYVKEVERDLKSGTLSSPAYQNALRAEALAVKHYSARPEHLEQSKADRKDSRRAGLTMGASGGSPDDGSE